MPTAIADWVPPAPGPNVQKAMDAVARDLFRDAEALNRWADNEPACGEFATRKAAARMRAAAALRLVGSTREFTP